MFRLTSLRKLGFGWLALVLCFSSAVDLVIDLAFEVSDVAAEEGAASSEPDNAAEHVLMPSPRGDGARIHDISAPALDLLASGPLVQFVDREQVEAHSTSPPPPRRRPVSFNVPLRI